MSANPETAPGATWSHELKKFWSADRDRLLHAFKTTIALVIGMGICMRLELATPRTAMVSIVIVMMHQHVGMAIARGIYRIIGMLVGGMVGLVLIARFAQAPPASSYRWHAGSASASGGLRSIAITSPTHLYWPVMQRLSSPFPRGPTRMVPLTTSSTLLARWLPA